MKYKLYDHQCSRYMGTWEDEGIIFENKRKAINYLINFFSIDQFGNLTNIRNELIKNNVYADIEIISLNKCEEVEL